LGCAAIVLAASFDIAAQAPAPIVFAHGDAPKAFDWSGSSAAIKGSLHSNGGIDISGSSHCVVAATTVVYAPHAR